MSDNASANFPPLVSREQVGNVTSEALRLFVGRGKRYSVKQLSNGAGVKDRMIECAMLRVDNLDYRPLPDWAFWSIASFLGSVFTSEVARVSQQGAFDLPEEEPDPGELAAETSETTARVVRMAVDGDFSNDCPQELKSTGTSLMNQGAHLVAIGARRKRRVA